MLFAIPESISGIFFGLIPFKATGSHLSEIQCTVTIKIPQDALLVKLIYLIDIINCTNQCFLYDSFPGAVAAQMAYIIQAQDRSCP